MYTIDFEYDKRRLSEYNMIICSFNGNSGIEPVSSGADITFNQGKSSGSNKFNLYSSTYENAYTATFQICKDPCKFDDDDKFYFSVNEVSAIQKWLCRNSYHKFKIDQDDYRNIYWNAVFSSKQILLNGRIVGLELTMYTDATYAYRDEICHVFHCTGENKSFDILDFNWKEGYIYPNIEITVLQPGNFILSFNGKESEIKNCQVKDKNEIITIDGDNQIISSSNAEHNIAKDFNFIFPRLENTYENNKNTFSVNLDCKIIIKYSPIVLIGL